MAKKPGVIVYLDLLPQLEEYSSEEAGELLFAILRYAEYGEIPEFEDRGLRVIWREVRAKIDRDNEKYKTRVQDGAYGAYVKDCQRRGVNAAAKELWLLNNADKF